MLDIQDKNIYCIYLPPLLEHSSSTLRGKDYADIMEQITKIDYIKHIEFINENYPNKLQLLLQEKDKILSSNILSFYYNLGFNNFCCATIEQAKAIKESNSSAKIVGSITMHITKEQILKDLLNYKKYFDSFVLDFSYNKNIQKIKMMPTDFDYILLTNALCNINCDGDHHWWSKNPVEKIECPGLIHDVGFAQSCMIRPMDLKYFDPYIKVYKIQDRGWTTNFILRDLVLYTTDYTLYPGIIYNEDEYQQHIYEGFNSKIR